MHGNFHESTNSIFLYSENITVKIVIRFKYFGYTLISRESCDTEIKTPLPYLLMLLQDE